MSTLQLGLIAIGAAVLLVLGLHTAWVMRRNRPLQAELVEPVAAAQSSPELQEPVLDDVDLQDLKLNRSMMDKKPGLDALLDVIAPIHLEALVSGEALLAAMPPTRRVGSKPFAIEALNIHTQRWELPQTNQRYSQCQAGVQLANRSGALNEIEFSEFVLKTQTFADFVSGMPDFPEMRQEVARARELDQFANEHDAQIGFVLRARRAAWSPSYISQMAARLGFIPAAMPGRLVVPSSLPGQGGIIGLGMDAVPDDAGNSALREITLTLDVAQVDRSERAFARMCEAALTLAQQMDGTVTDDNGVLLPREAMDVIAAELEHLYDTLDEREFSAGSVLARRLFS